VSSAATCALPGVVCSLDRQHAAGVEAPLCSRALGKDHSQSRLKGLLLSQ